MNIAIYARKSKLTDKGDSINMQIELCKNYVALKYPDTCCKITIYQDEGYSGGNIDRPDFKKMIDDCRLGLVDVVICYRLDRFSRNIADFSTTYEILSKYKVEFISVKESFDTSTPIGRAMLNIALVFSQLERETISERIRDNLLSLSQNGRWLGGTTPIGYQSKKVSYITPTGKEKFYAELELDPLYAPIVELIFDKYIELGSLSQLETYLIHHHITSRQKKYFGIHALREILANPSYCSSDIEAYNHFKELGCNITFPDTQCNATFGLVPFNRHKDGKSNQKNTFEKWIIAQGTHPPIIPASKWLMVQQQLKVNSTKTFNVQSGSTSQVALLSGLLYCKNCGAIMKVTNQCSLADGSISYIYRCSNKLRSKGKLCDIENAKGHYLDPFVLDQLQQLLPNKDALIKKLLANKNTFLNQPKIPSCDSNHIAEDLKQNTLQINNLVISLSKTQDDDVRNILLDEIKSLKDTNKKLQESIDSAEIPITKATYTLDNIDDMINRLLNFNQSINAASLNEKRMLLRSIINHIDWDGQHIDIYLITDPNIRDLPSSTNRNLSVDSKITYS